MMSEERKKVLEMLAAGKITADEAERLLDKLSGAASNATPANEPPTAAVGSATAKPKYLRIVVEKPGRDQVNVRVPISFIGSSRSLFAIMPKHVHERLEEYGINASTFSSMTVDELSQSMREINIDLDKGNGNKVRIYCE